MRRPPSALLLTSAIVWASSGGCRKETIDKPQAPDMSETLRTFDAPSGTFDQGAVTAVKASVDEAVKGLVGSGLAQQLVADVKDALADLKSGKAKAQALAIDEATAAEREVGASGAGLRPRAASLEGEGFGKVTRICPGWGAEPTPDAAANGLLTLTLTFTDLSVDPVVWGIADRCHVKLGPARVLVDRLDPSAPADLRIHLGGNLTVENVGTLPVVVALGARAQMDDVSVRGDYAVRVLPSLTTLELAVRVGDGDVVVVLSDGKDIAGVRAKNGTFTCDAAGCRGAAGEAVTW